MFVAVRRFCCFVVLASCANAGMPINHNGGDDTPVADAPVIHHEDSGHANSDTLPPVDAPPPLDAFVQLDAPPADAASALFCTDNNMCTNSGECCIMIGGAGICGTGVIVFGACIPQ